MKKWKCVVKDCDSVCYVNNFSWWRDWNYSNPSLYKWRPVSGWWIFKKWKCPQHNLIVWSKLSEAVIKYISHKSLELRKKPTLFCAKKINEEFNERIKTF